MSTMPLLLILAECGLGIKYMIVLAESDPAGL